MKISETCICGASFAYETAFISGEPDGVMWARCLAAVREWRKEHPCSQIRVTAGQGEGE